MLLCVYRLCFEAFTPIKSQSATKRKLPEVPFGAKKPKRASTNAAFRAFVGGKRRRETSTPHCVEEFLLVEWRVPVRDSVLQHGRVVVRRRRGDFRRDDR